MPNSTPIPQKRKKDVFADQPFAERFKDMGDKAEGKFVRVCEWQGLKYVRTGFDRPDLEHFETLPPVLRATPDFIVEFGRKHYYVECKGSGRVVKIKQETIEAMHVWNRILPVKYFVYNSVEDGYAFLDHEEVVLMVNEFGEKKQFENDRKVYYELPRSVFSFEKEKLNG